MTRAEAHAAVDAALLRVNPNLFDSQTGTVRVGLVERGNLFDWRLDNAPPALHQQDVDALVGVLGDQAGVDLAG